MGGDEDIVQAARVAYGQGTRKVTGMRDSSLPAGTSTSPLERVELKFHCSMPIRRAPVDPHRTANVNEMPGRYAPTLFYTPPESTRPQSKTNKQVARPMPSTLSRRGFGYEKRREGRRTVTDWWFCANDFARELARIDLPLSTYTQWYWKIDLHNLLHFLTLRVDSHAQWEIQQFGKVMAGMLKRVAPIAYEAWIDYEVCGARLSRMELNVLRTALKLDGRKERTEAMAYEMLDNGMSARNKMIWNFVRCRSIVLDLDFSLIFPKSSLRPTSRQPCGGRGETLNSPAVSSRPRRG
jgi:thymidylate synthase (FAD)